MKVLKGIGRALLQTIYMLIIVGLVVTAIVGVASLIAMMPVVGKFILLGVVVVVILTVMNYAIFQTK